MALKALRKTLLNMILLHPRRAHITGTKGLPSFGFSAVFCGVRSLRFQGAYLLTLLVTGAQLPDAGPAWSSPPPETEIEATVGFKGLIRM